MTKKKKSDAEFAMELAEGLLKKGYRVFTRHGEVVLKEKKPT